MEQTYLAFLTGTTFGVATTWLVWTHEWRKRKRRWKEKAKKLHERADNLQQAAKTEIYDNTKLFALKKEMIHMQRKQDEYRCFSLKVAVFFQRMRDSLGEKIVIEQGDSLAAFQAQKRLLHIDKLVSDFVDDAKHLDAEKTLAMTLQGNDTIRIVSGNRQLHLR